MNNFSPWTTARQSYALLGARWADAVRVALLWNVLTATAAISYLPIFYALATQRTALAIGARLFPLVTGLLLLVAWSSMSIAWQRMLLLNTQPSWFPAPLGGRLTYVGLMFAFLFVLLVGPVSLQQFQQIDSPETAGRAFGGLTTFAIALYCWPHIALRMPAIAVDDRRFTLKHAWAAANGISLGLLVGTFLVTAPAFAMAWFASRAVGHDTIVSYVLAVALYHSFASVSVLLGATFLALAYRQTVSVSSVFE